MILDGDTEIQLGGQHDSSGPRVKIEVLRRNARKILHKRPDLIEDAVQDAVIKLYSLQRDSFSNPNAFAATVAQNAARRLLKKELRQRIVADPKTVHEKVVQYDFELYLLFIEFLEAIHGQLGEDERAVALLAFLGLRRAEIARQLGLSPSTVFKYLRKIRKLIETLDPTDPPGGGGGGKGRPPPRASPVIRVYDPGAWRVAPLLQETISRPKEVEHGIAEVALQNRAHQAGGLGMSPDRHREEREEDRAPGARPSAALDELRGLLLGLPAFRGLAPGHADHVGDDLPRDLGDVLQRLVRGGPGRREGD